MYSKIIFIAAAVCIAAARPQAEHGHGHHATSSQSIVLHQTHHDPQYHEHHLFTPAVEHYASAVHHAIPVGHHVAHVVHKAAQVVHNAAPVVHKATTVVYKAAPVIYKAAPVVHAASAHHAEEHYEHYSHPKYEFAYHVEDKHTGDIKSQHETRNGDVVKGYYSLHEADGTTRIVHYTADKYSGFNAQVERKGHAKHIEPVHHKLN